MKILMTLIGLAAGSQVVLAQEHPQQLRITQSVAPNSISDQKAVRSIDANNVIYSGATALYTAGQSTLLQPGFMAQAGSVFSAVIAPVTTSRTTEKELRLVVRAYPNPFQDQMTIEYTLPNGAPVRYSLLDASGQLMSASNESVEQAAGAHRLTLDGRNLPAGTYLYRLQAGNETQTVRLLKKP